MKSELKWRVALIVALFTIGLCFVWASLWQQEIVLMDTLAGRPFNFMGFGTQGLEWWSWRDIFYLWIIFSLPLFALGGYFVGSLRERRRRRLSH